MTTLPEGMRGKVLASRVYPEFFPIHENDTVLFAGCGSGAQVVAYGNAGRKLVGVDVQEARAQEARVRAQAAGIAHFEAVRADIESLPFAKNQFDKIIAVDSIQHVAHPEKALAELSRILKPSGELLITFPALQHYCLTAVSRWRHGQAANPLYAVFYDRRKLHRGRDWNPDAFNHNLPLSVWLRLLKKSGFTVIRSRATTLFPPLHRWGVPRFWFSNETLHRVDWFFGGIAGIKRLGQALMCVCRKR